MISHARSVAEEPLLADACVGKCRTGMSGPLLPDRNVRPTVVVHARRTFSRVSGGYAVGIGRLEGNALRAAPELVEAVELACFMLE